MGCNILTHIFHDFCVWKTKILCCWEEIYNKLQIYGWVCGQISKIYLKKINNSKDVTNDYRTVPDIGDLQSCPVFHHTSHSLQLVMLQVLGACKGWVAQCRAAHI